MSLKSRLTLTVGFAVAIAILSIAIGAFFAVHRELSYQDDRYLEERADRLAANPNPGDPTRPPVVPHRERDRFLGNDEVIGQVVDRAGNVTKLITDSPTLTVSSKDLAMVDLAPNSKRVFRDEEIDGTPYRVLVIPTGSGRILQLGRDVTETHETLSALGIFLGITGTLGVGLAGLAAWLIAFRTVGPITRLSNAAETIARTNDLEHPIPVDRNDEVGRLATNFNNMLAALHTSRLQQRQLAADASHELRTPLTVLRANIEFLQRAQTLDPVERAELLTETRLELDELTNLVAELVDLASDATSQEAIAMVSLTDLVDGVADRFRRRSGREISVSGEGTQSLAVRATQAERAISNLVDNALKFSEAPIEIILNDRTVQILDRGIGVPAGDETRVFDRFYRAETARKTSGSGLGLAIVKKIAQDHGGAVSLVPRDGGGSVATFTFGVLPV